MKNYELILTDYDFEGRDEKGAKTMTVVMKDELSALLRVVGVYDNGIETCDGIDIVKQIKSAKASLEVDESELNLIKKVLDKLIKNENFKLGGVRYEELIMRVFKAEPPKKKDSKDGSN